jgi:AraC-like DNA-binding protein
VAPLDVTTPAFTPLSSRAVYRTSDPEVATKEAARLFARHRLRVLDRPARFDAMANVGDLSGVAINYVTFGTPVQIERPPTDTYLGLMVPLSGRLTVEHEGQAFHADPALGTGVVLGPGWVRMSWSADCQVLSFVVSPSRLEEQAHRLLPAADASAARFATSPLAGNELATIRALAQLAADTFDRGAASTALPATVLTQLREAVLTAVLLGIPSSLTPSILRETPPRRRASVQAAIDLIAAEGRGDLSLGDIADRVGVGLRALELGFKQELDMTPMQYLRLSRLRRAYDELQNAGPGSELRVAEVAQKWGFFHTGRFSQMYRERFGEHPSATLKSAEQMSVEGKRARGQADLHGQGALVELPGN